MIKQSIRRVCAVSATAAFFALSPGFAVATAPGPSSPLAPLALHNFTAGTPVDTLPDPFPKAEMIAALESLRAHGLNPDDYHLAYIREHGTSGEAALYALDAWMSAAGHISSGKLAPQSVEPDWTAARRSQDLAQFLRDSMAAGTLATSFDRLAPQHKSYQALKSELAVRLQAQANPKPPVESGPTLRLNDRGPRVVQLRARLGLPNGDVFDNDLQTALIDFQQSAGLDDDGLAGPATIRALNRNGAEEIAQLRVNLERWRWLPDDLGKKHVRVNIADFSVQAWQNGAVDRVHSAIVGKPFRATPVFSDEIEYLVLNPWWETPASLARRDKLPSFKRDPSAVDRLGYQVLDSSGQTIDASTIDWNAIPAGTMPYRLRQRPGPLNALGQVKIMFPNKHNVYLHDTPDRGLFARRQRAFSSGCIRTQDPLDLSAWLLSDQAEWSRERIQSVVDSGRETRVNLTQKVPVHVLYMTAVSDEAGVRFVDDIYGRDAAILAGLNTGPKR